MNLFFLKIRSHNLGFICLGVVVKKPNVANSRLLSLSFVMFELLMCYQNPRCLFHGYLKNCASLFRLLVLLLSEFLLLLSSLLSLLLELCCGTFVACVIGIYSVIVCRIILCFSLLMRFVVHFVIFIILVADTVKIIIFGFF